MKNLLKALASFQQEVPVIHKCTQGYGYSYADLPTIFEVINPLLQKHGIGFTQMLDTKEGIDFLVTIVFHIESGENMESRVQIPKIQLAKMNEYQSYGSGVTYYRRYAISAILCLVTDKDTDATGEQVKAKQPVQPKAQVEDEQISKPSIDKTRLAKAIEAIKEDRYSVEALLETFTLTPAQMKEVSKLTSKQ